MPLKLASGTLILAEHHSFKRSGLRKNTLTLVWSLRMMKTLLILTGHQVLMVMHLSLLSLTNKNQNLSQRNGQTLLTTMMNSLLTLISQLDLMAMLMSNQLPKKLKRKIVSGPILLMMSLIKLLTPTTLLVATDIFTKILYQFLLQDQSLSLKTALPILSTLKSHLIPTAIVLMDA